MRPLRAQEVAAYLGFGGAHDSSNGAQIETFSDGNLYKTPSVGGLFAHLGASVFVTEHVGVGAEISWIRHRQGTMTCRPVARAVLQGGWLPESAIYSVGPG